MANSERLSGTGGIAVMPIPPVPVYVAPISKLPNLRPSKIDDNQLFVAEWLRWFNAIRLQASVVLTSPFSLGGSDSSSVPMGVIPDYAPVINAHYFVAPATFEGVVRSWAWARNGGVAARTRLYDLTDSLSVGVSGWVTAVSRPINPEAYAVSLTEDHVYRLEIVTDTASESGFGIGDLYEV